MIYYQACSTFSEEYWEITEPEDTMQIKTIKIWNHFSKHCKETGKVIEKTRLHWFNTHQVYIYLYDMTVLFFQFVFWEPYFDKINMYSLCLFIHTDQWKFSLI